MQALALQGFDVPAAVTELPDPRPGPGEILVRVGGSSINAFDVFVALGMAKDYMPYGFPTVIGSDLAGVVVEAGDGVTGFAPGDRVFGSMGMKGALHDGAFGELATPQAAFVVATPDDVDDAQAGCLGVAGTTAMSAIDALGLSEGASVLILGATGGVGSFAIQLAAALGAHVIASVRPGDESFVTGLGASETVDYTADLRAAVGERYPNGIDALIDAVNRDVDTFASLAGSVRGGGRATSVIGAAGTSTRIGEVEVSNTGGNPAHLEALAARIAAGTLRAAISRTYPLGSAAQALKDFVDEHTLGKLAIVME